MNSGKKREERSEDAPSALPTSLRLFFLIAFLNNMVALTIEKVSQFVLHKDWPYVSPFLDEPGQPDFAFAFPIFAHIHTLDFFSPTLPLQFLYPAALAPLFGFFISLPSPKQTFRVILFLVAVASAVGFAAYLRQHTKLTGIQSLLLGIGALLLSYPVAFEFKQGNMEIFICLIVGAGVWFFLRERYHAAAFWFGIAIAMKLFPFIYLGLFLGRRRVWPIFTAVVTAAVVTVASLYYIYPSISVSWHGIQQNLATYQATTPLAIRREIGYDHSLFAFAKITDFLMHHGSRTLSYVHLLRSYMAIAAVAGLLAYFLRIRRMPIINQVLCLSIVSVLLPPVSYDYTLMHLYIPWAMLVFFAIKRGRRETPGLYAVFTCLALTTSIESEVVIKHHAVGGQIKALVLLTMFLLALRFPFATESGTVDAGMVESGA